MKNGKAAGPSGWVSEIVKAAEEVRVVTITGIVKGIISAEWELSSIVHCYEEKEFALERKLYGTEINRSNSENSWESSGEVDKTKGGY